MILIAMASESLRPDGHLGRLGAGGKATSSQVLGDRATGSRTHRSPPQYGSTRVQRARALLAALREEQIRLDVGLDDAVINARRAKVSWEQIAAELGMPRQVAWERWRRLDAEANG
jgi:hypothetical protein